MSERRLSIVALVVGVIALILSGSLIVLLYLGFPLFPFQRRAVERGRKLMKYEETLDSHRRRIAVLMGEWKKRHPIVEKWIYKISPVKREVPKGLDGWGEADTYLEVYHNGERIIRTSTVEDRSAVTERYPSVEIVFKVSEQEWAGDYLRVELWDKDYAEDDLLASWRVFDPIKLKNLSSDGCYVNFDVKKGKKVSEERLK